MEFDEQFESTRLAMLAQQYSDIVFENGEVVFRAEDHEDRISGTSWSTAGDTFEKASKSGLKIHLIELLDNFIQYRGMCKKLPKKDGVVRFGNGSIHIEWLPEGESHLSHPADLGRQD